MNKSANYEAGGLVRNRRGQSLILALLVMFMLAFIGGMFIILIGRNIRRTQRSGEVLTAEYLAEAGIRYADDQLTYGRDGADWRPMPTPTTNPDDPDTYWLDLGFSRFTYGNGRFLVKVTYEPKPNDPVSKFLKINVVGRIGVFDPNDPTTWGADQPMRARKEKVAYKAIGITDYARFITNKDRRSEELPLGAPGFVTNFGDENSGYGGSLRVNGDLLWYGKDYIWLNPAKGDVVEVAGDIRHAVKPDPATVPPAPDAPLVYVNNALAQESADPTFNTDPTGVTPSDGVGLYRDGRQIADISGRPRNVFRLDPPLVDEKGTISGLGRYRDLTRNSGVWILDPGNVWFNTGYYGWGEGIYINNRDDIQAESSVYTLRGNWTEPGGPYWIGPYYVPPGVHILLTPYDLDNADGDDDIYTGPDMVLTHDTGTGEAKFNWHDASGNVLSGFGERLIMPYPKNGVIFAEGNVRIEGMLPKKTPEFSPQFTVVSGGTIYVEGNILKNRYNDNGNIIEDDTGAIALLAADNVCVNTTQFFGPLRDVLSSYNSDEGGGNARFEVTSDRSFWFDYSCGLDAANDYNGAPPIDLYVRHTSDRDAGPSYMNMLVNYPPNGAELGGDPYYSIYQFNNIAMPLFRQYVYPLADPSVPLITPTQLAAQKLPNWECNLFQLFDPTSPPDGFNYWPDPGVYNRIGFQLDSNEVCLPYLLSRMAVQPCDIRIEALMYAQNGSFFVIPGEWFNPDPQDTDLVDITNPDPNRARPASVVDKAWPLYGQPLDVKITIFGAVSENLPAAIGDTAAWMEKWGWIPPKHGNVDPVARPGHDTTPYRDPLDPSNDLFNGGNDARQQGLTIIYDDFLSNPQTGAGAIRIDTYNRLLPIAPKLPVSPQLLYFGEPT